MCRYEKATTFQRSLFVSSTQMAMSSGELQDFFEDIDWEAFNDLRLDDATIERDLAAVADRRVHAAFDAAQDHYLRSAPEGASESTRSRCRYIAYVVFCGRKTGVFRTW